MRSSLDLLSVAPALVSSLSRIQAGPLKQASAMPLKSYACQTFQNFACASLHYQMALMHSCYNVSHESWSFGESHLHCDYSTTSAGEHRCCGRIHIWQYIPQLVSDCTECCEPYSTVCSLFAHHRGETSPQRQYTFLSDNVTYEPRHRQLAQISA